jgi:murein DD-endopeptidase MepM/ murein hydrolase activator NlpD
MTLGAMAGAAALLVATSLPANAFFGAAPSAIRHVTGNAPMQELRVEDSVVIEKPTRDSYTVVSLVQQIAATYAAAARSTQYTNNPLGTVQWPFPVSVPIASGFGPRHVTNCGFCSTFHQGLDFTPGSGVPIQAIADGVVSKVEFDSGGLGNNVWIDHTINGQRVTSVYAHMMNDSVLVKTGQLVKVADEIGKVGNTGASTGAHLHLEVHLDGTPVDPFAWLKANAN